jgi:hypothetical protein
VPARCIARAIPGSVHDRPQPIRRSKPTTKALAASLHELVNSHYLHPVASSLGDRIRAETGVENAVRQIEEEFA